MNRYLSTQKRTIIRKTMTVSDDVSLALLRLMKPGNENVTLQVGTLSQVLKKDTAARLSQQLVTLPSTGDGAAISFKLPTLENVTSPTDVMGLQVSLNILPSLSPFKQSWITAKHPKLVEAFT